MAVTETKAETDGSLTAVTVAETETDCRTTNNMCTEAVEERERERESTPIHEAVGTYVRYRPTLRGPTVTIGT